MIKVSPSILSADFANLEKDFESIKQSGGDYIHYDVMDGHFVPNLALGIPDLTSVRKVTDLPIDVHLMISNPSVYAGRFCKAGADIVTVHLEAESEESIAGALRCIRACGKRAGLSIKPGTAAEAVLPFAGLVDLILVMTVEPGFGGQSFMHGMLDKISRVRSIISEKGLDCELEVDGGVNEETGRLCVEHGADVLVAGSYFFSAKDRAEAVKLLKGQA